MVSLRVWSMLVALVGRPPAAVIRNILPASEKRISPFLFHDPPRKTPPTSHKVCAGPPVIDIVFSLLSAQKPICWLSADQKGIRASSVPFTGCGVPAFKECSHNWRLFGTEGSVATQIIR